jgi:hypothetical protein
LNDAIFSQGLSGARRAEERIKVTPDINSPYEKQRADYAGKDTGDKKLSHGLLSDNAVDNEG